MQNKHKQSWFIAVLRFIGLKGDDIGLCHGLSFAAMQATEAGEFEKFRERLTRLSNLSSEELVSLREKLREPNKNAPEQKLKSEEKKLSPEEIDIAAFLQTVDLHQHLVHYQELLHDQKFDGIPITSQITVAPLLITKPVEIEKKEKMLNSELCSVQKIIAAYSKENITGEGFSLESYFRQAKKLFENSVEPVSMLMSCGDHVIFVSCDKKGIWTFVDANVTNDNKGPKVLTFSSESELANQVSESFFGGDIIFIADIWGYKDELLTKSVEEFKEGLYRDHPFRDQKHINMKNASSYTQVMIAAQYDLPDLVKELIEAHADPNIETANNFTALFQSARQGNINMVKTLLENKADPKHRNNAGISPFWIACHHGYSDIVEILFDKNEDINKANFEGETALHGASKKGQLRVVDFLIDKKADLNALSNAGFAALHLASTPEVTEALLKAQADPNKKGFDRGNTPLLLAISRLELEKVKKLLQYHADPNIPADNGTPPLYSALSVNDYPESRETYFAIFEALLEYKADPNSANKQGITALHVVSGRGRLHMMEKLLSNRAKVDSVDAQAETPLFYAAKNGQLQALNKLLENGADVKKTNKEGMRPLTVACKAGKLDIVVSLLDKDPDVNFATPKGITALCAAIQSKNVDLVKLLIKKGADVNAKNELGNTPIHMAIELRNPELVKLLLEHGADSTQLNKNNLTPEELASKINFTAGAEIILNFKKDNRSGYSQ